MQNGKKIVVIIPARGGSKGISNKNIIDFCGKPLLVWSILQSRGAKTVDDVYVTSDSEAILSIAKQYKALPILRPQEFATDTATSESALLHAIDCIKAEKGNDPDLVVFLQLTSPLRESNDIDSAVKKIMEDSSDSLFSDVLLDDFCAWHEEKGMLKGKTFDPFNRGRRQDRKPLYFENGSIYIFKPSILRKFGNRLGGKIAHYDMPFWKSYEIDKIEDLEICEFFFRKHLLSYWVDLNNKNMPTAEDIDLIVYDFDGVMTNNRVLVFEDGKEGVIANRADGLGVGIIKRLGIPQIILSTEANPVVQARGRKLGIAVVQNCADKKVALTQYCKEYNFSLNRVLFIGNDINDIEAMQIVGYPVAPADAHNSVKKIAAFQTKAAGGEGVVKEIAETIISINLTKGS